MRYLISVIVLVFVATLFFSEVKLINSDVDAQHVADKKLAQDLTADNKNTDLDNTMIKQVAKHYQQQSQWPSYSIPVQQDQVELLNPNAGGSSQFDLNTINLDAQLTITTDKYRYQVSELILVTVEISGISHDQVTGVELATSDLAFNNSQSLDFIQSRQAEKTLVTAEFKASESQIGENRIVLMAKVNGENYRQTVSYEVFQTVARVTSLAAHYIRDNHLIVPVNISQAKAGYYKLAANLYGENAALAHLTAMGKIDQQGQLELKIYGSLLANLPAKEKLSLQNIQLRYVPAKPGNDEKIQWGDSSQSSYDIGPVDFSQFNTEPFQSAAAQQRVEFLQKL